jgi:acetyl esterase/lipase
VSGSSDLALAAGYVVVESGARGRDLQADDGTYYGKAPAAIVDLKAAVRYLHHNDAVMPGNAEWIVSRGTSAGGALSALLGASAGSDLYDAELAALGAADASDAIFAVAAFCPITDLEHADMAYEWVFGSLSSDADLSQLLADAYPAYLASLGLEADDGSALTADFYAAHLVQQYLAPSATAYLLDLSDDERTAYLAANPWITWQDETASFTLEDFATHVGRKKSVTAFDALDLSAAENSLFGNTATNARHFTAFSAAQTNTTLDPDIASLVNLMNPMSFIGDGSASMPDHWWLRVGSSDSDTAPTVVANLAISLENMGKDVNTSYYWDAGHGADMDPEAMIAWIGDITGYSS